MPEIAGVSAGGMPDRVKCLHVLAGQSLAQGRGVNPLGDEVLDRLGAWWSSRPVRPDRPDGRAGMTRVAAIDCGTNTIKLLVADLDPDEGRMVEHVRETRIVRLGQGVDRTGRLAEASLERVFAAVDEYAAIVAKHDVETTRFCATSAARDAENADVFRSGVEERLGVAPEVVTGDEEARLSLDGATRLLAAGLAAPYLVIDIGGGSTELILGTDDGQVLVGAVARRRLGAAAPSATSPATRRRGGGRGGDRGHRPRPGRLRRRPGRGGRGDRRRRHGDHDRGDGARPPGVRPRDPAPLGARPRRVQGVTSRLLTMTVGERQAAALHAPGPRRRDRRRCADPRPGPAPYDVDSMLVSEYDILDGIAWSQV